MGVITKTKTWADAENVLYTDLNADFDNLYNEFNGNIENANIKSGAAIDVTKISGTAVNLGSTQQLSNKELLKPKITASYQTLVTDTDASTVTFDLSASNIHTLVLGGNRTLALTNATVGQAFLIRLVQDGTGTRTVTWFSTIKWQSNVVPTLTTTINKTDLFGFICTSTGNYDGVVVSQNL